MTRKKSRWTYVRTLSAVLILALCGGCPAPIANPPSEPESVQPGPVASEPVEPDPVDPAPVEPEPLDPTPVEPESALALELVSEGLVSPVGFAYADDGTERAFIVDQVGRIWVLDREGNRLSTPFLDVSGELPPLSINFDERGLLGLAFHPNYSTNGRFFVRYSRPRDGEPAESCNDPESFVVGCHSEVLVEYRVSNADPNVADPDSQRILMVIDKPQFNHNGGQVAFGPDGFLYTSFGDGGGANDNEEGHTPGLGNGQDRTTLLGKIIRIDVDRGDPYAIPEDNPFADDEDARPEIWAFGLRNPWRFSFDTGPGRRLFVGDVGQNRLEEVDIVAPGGNFGWNIKEGNQCFDPNAPDTPPQCANINGGTGPLLDPVIEYAHFDADGRPFGTAVIGGYVYRGLAVPSLQDRYIFGDFSSSFEVPDGVVLMATEEANGRWTLGELPLGESGSGRIGRFILAFGQDVRGEVYVLTSDIAAPRGTGGRVFRIAAAP